MMAVLDWEQKAYCEQLWIHQSCLLFFNVYVFIFLYKTGIKFDPREPRVLRKDGVIVSHSLAAFAYLRGRSVN